VQPASLAKKPQEKKKKDDTLKEAAAAAATQEEGVLRCNLWQLKEVPPRHSSARELFPQSCQDLSPYWREYFPSNFELLNSCFNLLGKWYFKIHCETYFGRFQWVSGKIFTYPWVGVDVDNNGWTLDRYIGNWFATGQFVTGLSSGGGPWNTRPETWRGHGVTRLLTARWEPKRR